MTSPPKQILPPNPNLQLVNPSTGILTTNGLQFLQQLWALVSNSSPIVPCSASHIGNKYLLTPLLTTKNQQGIGTPVNQYFDYQIWSFVAPATSTGTVSAQVGSLPVWNVYKSSGSTPAGSGDVVSGDLYLLIAVNALNSGNGGLVLK